MIKTFSSILGMLCLLTGCETTEQQAVRVDSTVVQSSYDYARPASLPPEAQRPVLILPTTTTGWEPARVTDDGRWEGGRYTADIIEQPHWATLEEAELSGKPYFLPGTSAPIVPVPSTPTPSDIQAKKSDLMIAGLQKKVDALETKIKGESRSPTPTMSQEEAARISAAAAASGGSDLHSQRPAYIPEVAISPTAIPSRTSRDRQQSAGVVSTSNSSPSTLVLPSPNSHGDTDSFNIVPPGRKGKVTVHYLDNHNVEVTYKEKVYKIHLRNPDDQIKLTIPSE